MPKFFVEVRTPEGVAPEEFIARLANLDLKEVDGMTLCKMGVGVVGDPADEFLRASLYLASDLHARRSMLASVPIELAEALWRASTDVARSLDPQNATLMIEEARIDCRSDISQLEEDGEIRSLVQGDRKYVSVDSVQEVIDRVLDDLRGELSVDDRVAVQLGRHQELDLPRLTGAETLADEIVELLKR